MEYPKTGGFTMPGEAGCEALTLELAKRWGADVIRDSDGTKLSDEILDAGYQIYSTVCIIREHNAWGREHPECLQQTFLGTQPLCAVSKEPLCIPIMQDFFAEHVRPNTRPEAMRYWQVWDRTAQTLVPTAGWSWQPETNCVLVAEPVPFHSYTVSFLAYRLWEEINMYNSTTNGWTSEHLMPIDPRRPEAQAYLTGWLKQWCEEHPQTDVVRFTSMFYNFAWIWGADERNRSLFTDWGSYDFTVSEKALADFEAEYGYALTAEDFVNNGNYQVTHQPPTAHKRDYMAFTQKFVAEYGAKLVALVHSYGKKAYVFYDDSWVGVEPYGPHFAQFGFDGMIKCVFSGYEARMCAGVKAEVHEIRLHPYLFPVGLGGAPTFQPGGDPAHDAQQYWSHVRRALLRDKIDRIGLGGYLHLVPDFPDFIDTIERIANESRAFCALHESGAPNTLPITVAVLHCWGSLRPWTLSGHFHETYMHDLIHINESLAGLPVSVKFLSFEDVKNGGLDGVDVVINAGRAGTAWSGGDAWKDADLVAALTKWVYEGGVFLGVGEPSAVSGFGDYFRMARILGVDEDTGARVCHGRWPVTVQDVPGLIPEEAQLITHEHLYLTDAQSVVLAAVDGKPAIVTHAFGKGRGIYLGGYAYSAPNSRMLLNLLLWAKGLPLEQDCLPDDPWVECAWFASSRQLVAINNAEEAKTANIPINGKTYRVELPPLGTSTLELPQN